jgi:rubredoxin
MTTETPGNKCLVCGYRFEAASGMTHDHKPGEGDISICLNCGAALIFNKDLSLRFPTPEEKAYITMDRDVLNAQIARAHVVTEDLRKRQPKDHCDAGPLSPSAMMLAEKLRDHTGTGDSTGKGQPQ